MIFFLVVFYAHPAPCLSANRLSASPESIQAKKLSREYLHKVLSRYPLGLVCESTWIPDKVKEFSFTFQQQQAVDVEEARQAVVPLINEFVEMLTGDEEIHPYLAHHEYEKLLRLHVMFIKPSGLRYKKPHISAVMLIKNGVIIYLVSDPEEVMAQLVHEETYQEALERLGEAKTTEDEEGSSPE